MGATVIPRHEYPGRIVPAIGLCTSSLCVVGLIVLWFGLGGRAISGYYRRCGPGVTVSALGRRRRADAT